MKNKLTLFDSSIIYVACPANSATGGPELLHQLVYQLNSIGARAFMYYYDSKSDNPVHKEYLKYQNPHVCNVKDDKTNILVVPEVTTGVLYDYSNIQKVIWWLSVDNYSSSIKFTSRLKSFIKSRKIRCFNYYSFNLDESIQHCVQSYYAKNYLINNGIDDIVILSDYLNEAFLELQLKKTNSIKKNVVLYNPNKGEKFTKKLIDSAKNINFLPIENLTRDEVCDLLTTAKVYIDFGNHPGKDRIPREAAVSGCCIIVGLAGSARYFEDVAIDDEFKFDITDENILKIVNKINECLKDYEIHDMKFNSYREKIKQEKGKFSKDVKEIFKKQVCI
jgi:hypothetical protein